MPSTGLRERTHSHSTAPTRALKLTLCLGLLTALSKAQSGPPDAPQTPAGQPPITGVVQSGADIDRLLRLELFQTALELADRPQAAQPGRRVCPDHRLQAARLGNADDHYLARNFSAACSSYQAAISGDGAVSQGVRLRWGIALALALTEADGPHSIDLNTARLLRSQAHGVLEATNAPVLTELIDGFLAEHGGQNSEAARCYAAALGTEPVTDNGEETLHQLRVRAVNRARELWYDTPIERREGVWALIVPGAWKHRRTANFDIYAHNDFVAQAVAEAAEYHLAARSNWFGGVIGERWTPRCEIRVHATLSELHGATGTDGITYAVSHTDVQGDRILRRKLNVFQVDPWLLSSTLPHELTHLLIAERCRQTTMPLAIDEGLALQGEPPARRQMYQRLLETPAPSLSALLTAERLPTGMARFYAESGTLVAWLLSHLERTSPVDPEQSSRTALLKVFAARATRDWWSAFGFASERAAQADWHAWHADRRARPQQPLLDLIQPVSPDRQPGR